jgi:uncharacterized delta-60 repeat protein
VARYNANGSLDSTFNGNGRVVTNLGGSVEVAKAVAVRNGKIIVAGYSNTLGTQDFVVLRYTGNGTLDTTFNSTGRRVTDLGGDDRAAALALQGDEIVVAGATNVFGTFDFALVRYTSTGSLDTTFDLNGQKITSFGKDDRATAVTIQNDGKIVAAGYSNTLGTFDFAVARYTRTGSLDVTFDGDGKKLTSFGKDDRANAVTIQSNDGSNNEKIVAAGWSTVFGPAELALARYQVR